MGGFSDFLFRGNLITLAVAFIMGAAFGNLVTAFTNGMITPILGIFGGVPKFTDLSFKINSSEFLYGKVIDAGIVLLITALVLYYLVVWPSNWVMEKFKKEEEDKNRNCPECQSKISKEARKCPFCTSAVVVEKKLMISGAGDQKPAEV